LETLKREVADFNDTGELLEQMASTVKELDKEKELHEETIQQIDEVTIPRLASTYYRL